MFGSAGKCVIIFRTSTIRIQMRLINNHVVEMCPSTPPFTGAADVRMTAVISADWLKDAGISG